MTLCKRCCMPVRVHHIACPRCRDRLPFLRAMRVDVVKTGAVLAGLGMVVALWMGVFEKFGY